MRAARTFGLLATSLVLCGGALAQGSTSASFQVRIQLTVPGSPAAEPASRCETQTLTSAPNALVRVVCNSGRFVSIAPDPRKPFVGSHGGAYRFHLQPSSVVSGLLDEGLDPLWWGRGTVTAMRIYGAPREPTDPLEMLVSF